MKGGKMKGMRIFAFADEASRTLKGQIAAMKRNGLDGLEIRELETGNVSDMTCGQAKEVRRALEAEGLTVWSVGSPIGKIDLEAGDYAAHKDKFKHTLEIANLLGAGNMRIFSFYIPRGKAPEAFKGQVLDRLSGRVPCIHLKDFSYGRKMEVVGEGNLNFERVFEKAEAAGTEYMLVEQDDCNGEDPFACLDRSYRNLRAFGFR